MIIDVKVNPNSSENRMEKISENKYRISLKSVAKDNKANIELIKILEKHFNSNVRILKGLKSKNKKVLIE